MNVIIQAIKTRRSCRSFRSEQLREEDLAQILDAGTWAASGMGRQPAVMVAVQDPETRETLRRMNAAVLGNPTADPFYGAPTIVVVLADTGASTAVEDGSLVMGNLLLAASSLGVGSCWIHRAHEEFESAEGKALLKKWGLTGSYRGVGHCALGYPAAAAAAPKPRKADYIVRV